MGACWCGKQPAGLEVIHRNDDRQEWLVAWFENERLKIGVLHLATHPWSLTRLPKKSDLAPWLASLL